MWRRSPTTPPVCSGVSRLISFFRVFLNTSRKHEPLTHGNQPKRRRAQLRIQCFCGSARITFTSLKTWINWLKGNQEWWSQRLYSIQHEKSPGQDAATIHRLKALSSFSVWWCISVLCWWVFVFFIPSQVRFVRWLFFIAIWKVQFSSKILPILYSMQFQLFWFFSSAVTVSKIVRIDFLRIYIFWNQFGISFSLEE